MNQCKHNELIKEQPIYTGMDVTVKNKDVEMPQLIVYSPYICKECGKQYLVLQAVVGGLEKPPNGSCDDTVFDDDFDGYDEDGYDKEGFNKDGMNRRGHIKDDYDENWILKDKCQ